MLDTVVAGDAEAAAEIMLRHVRGSLGAKAASRLARTVPTPRDGHEPH